MYHQHFKTIASTQIYLKNNLELLLEKGDNEILISCSKQTEGIGRRGNHWESFANGLAMSFTLRPNNTLTLTPLEIGLITIRFLKKSFAKDLTLKWPNDIISSDGKKCGGIICNFINPSTIIAGLGLNLGKFMAPLGMDFRHGLGSVDQSLELNSFDQQKIAQDLYAEITAARLSNREELKEIFNHHCAHLNKKVSILDEGENRIGLFRGIGDNGEALVEIDSTLCTFNSSSLTIID